jgi:hypothetical protein
MLSIGSAAFDHTGRMVSTFYMNLNTLREAEGDPRTMRWWETKPEAWAAARKDPRPPFDVMEKFINWVESTSKAEGRTPVFVGYPAGFDFLFVYWYMIRFVGRSPFSFSALDIKSYAMAVLGTEYRRTSKKNMPKEWFTKTPHDHTALNDAIGQGELFVNMLKKRLETK